MLDERDLQAIAALIKAETDPINNEIRKINSKLEGMGSRLDSLEETADITREGVNSLLEWAEAVSNAVRFPLPKVN